ncbi:MAG: KAP family NTPase [Robiginitomaculum sp.]|nr:KAP family NTPase [Robiginitomaculum sp.]
MSTRNKIENYLKNWVNTQTPPKFGVLIEGKWGAGKTHFIKSILTKKGFTKKKTIYLSLFGMSSIENLETQLFFASANIAQKTFHRGASIASSLLKGTLRIDINGDDKSDGAIDANFKGFNKFVEKISKNLNNALIIFDDLERCAIPMSEFLGFANQFIEHEDVRILFVANTKKMAAGKKKEFDNFKEKVIGHSLELKAQPNEALKSFISEIDNKTIRDILDDLSPQIIGLFDKSGYQNLRALRQFIWHYAELLEAIDNKYRDNNYFLQNLTEQFFVFFTEFKLDLGNDGLSLSDLVSKATSSNCMVLALHPDKDKEPSPKYRALSKYSDGSGGYDTVIPVSTWIEILQSGLIEPKLLNQNLSESKYLKSSNPAWLRFVLFDDHEDEVVELAKDELFDQFKNRKLHEVGAMLHMFALRFMMSENGIIDENIQTVENSCCKYIDDLLSSGDLPPRPTDMHWPENLRFESNHGYAYWTTDAYKENFNNVHQYLIKARIQAFENHGPEIAREILTALQTNFEKFTKLISYRLEGGKYASIPVLQHIDVEEFIDAWLSLPKANWRPIQYAFDSRYENGRLQNDEHHTGELAVERDWAIQLRQSLESRAAKLDGYKRLRITRIIPRLPQAE